MIGMASVKVQIDGHEYVYAIGDDPEFAEFVAELAEAQLDASAEVI